MNIEHLYIKGKTGKIPIKRNQSYEISVLGCIRTRAFSNQNLKVLSQMRTTASYRATIAPTGIGGTVVNSCEDNKKSKWCVLGSPKRSVEPAAIQTVLKITK